MYLEDVGEAVVGIETWKFRENNFCECIIFLNTFNYEVFDGCMHNREFRVYQV